MLTITRNINQSITIETSDGEIEIQICDVQGSYVRVGINTPDHVWVTRTELEHAEKLGT